MGGPDDGFSIEPDELEGLCRDLRKAHSSLGRVKSGPGTEESSNIQFRRHFISPRIYSLAKSLKNRHKKRQTRFGLPPKCANKVVGAPAAIAIERHAR